MEIIMTTLIPQTRKMALSFLILFASFEGEGRAQVMYTIIQKQCAVNCVSDFINNYKTCAKNLKSQKSCLNTPLKTLEDCMKKQYTRCEQCSESGLTNFVDQAAVVTKCFTPFKVDFDSSTTVAGVAPYITSLSTCVTQFPSTATCPAPSESETDF